MKTKAISNRIISFLIAFVMVVVSSLAYSIPVKANIITTGWEKFDAWASKTGLKFTNILPFALSQWGCLTDGNFEQWILNQDSFLDYWNDNYVEINEETDDITFSPDFVKYIKQALKEYQNEQYGYQIVPTMKYDQIPVSKFSNGAAYRSMCELAKTYGVINIYLPSTASFWVQDVSPYTDGTSGFYVNSYSSYGGKTYYGVKLMDYTLWADKKTNVYYLASPSALDDAVSTYDELATIINDIGTASNNKVDSALFSSHIMESDIYNATNWGGMWHLVSYTGSDVLVFNSSTSLKNYSVDKRGVFTTKDFYEDTGELTLKLDDLNNSIGDLTDLLEQFKDLLGKQEGGLTEEQLQQLLQQFLDDFFDRLGNQGGDDDNGGGSSSGGGSSGGISESFQRTIEGYFEGVLSYLDNILYEIQNLEFITAESGVDTEHSDLSDMFDLIWKDPENNTQAVADELSQSFGDIAGSITKKFPFSIPWDVYGLFTVLADVDPPQAASTYSLLSDDSDYAISGSNTYEMDVAVYSRDSNGNEHSAPYFELPIILERYGIEEYIIVDLQYFQPISTLSRTMLSLLFGVFLMKFTIKVIDLFKGGTDS